MKTYHYIIKGLVQGVCFRYYTVQEAQKCGVVGTVRNTYNGDVETYVQGDEEAIRKFEAFLHQGPSLARVDRVIKEELDQDQVYTSFDIVF